MTEQPSSEYGWNTATEPESCGYIAPRIITILRSHGVQRVLDVGSGNGAFCRQLSDSGFEAVGIEQDENGVLISKGSHPQIPFYRLGVQDDPKKLLSSEQKFDAVVSTEVVEHLFAPHMLPRFANACLRKKGILILSTPYHGYLKNLAIAALDKWDLHHDPLWHGGHIKFWSRATLTKLLDDEGLRVTDFVGVGRLPFLWKSMILVAERSNCGFHGMSGHDST